MIKETQNMVRYVAATVLMFAGISTAAAAIKTSFTSLLIDGNYYDVTIHISGSFASLWDLDLDGDYTDDDGSLLRSAPMFWGNESGAQAAAIAIIDAYGTTDGHSSLSDAFKVPYAYGTNKINESVVYSWEDDYLNYDVDSLVQDWEFPDWDANPIRPYASFTLVDPVPIPAAFWLFGSALAGLGIVAKRRRGAEAV